VEVEEEGSLGPNSTVMAEGRQGDGGGARRWRRTADNLMTFDLDRRRTRE